MRHETRDSIMRERLALMAQGSKTERTISKTSRREGDSVVVTADVEPQVTGR